MKTVIQELKEEIQSKVFQSTNLTDYQYGHNVAYGVVLTIVEYLLEKEKEQIIKAVEDTRGNIVPRMFISENLSGEEYYNQTYNQ